MWEDWSGRIAQPLLRNPAIDTSSDICAHGLIINYQPTTVDAVHAVILRRSLVFWSILVWQPLVGLIVSNRYVLQI